LANENAAGYTPNVNSEVLPETLKTAFTTGDFNRVPVINGTNRDEWRLFVALSELAGNPVTASNYQSMISSTLGVPPAVAEFIAAKYPLTAFPSPSVALGAVGTDAIFACPALTIDQSVSRFVPTFAYEFNDENAPELFLPPVSFPYGAAHASEIQYLMELPAAAFPKTLSAQQLQLAAVMKGYWTNFAKRGFPPRPAPRSGPSSTTSPRKCRHWYHRHRRPSRLRGHAQLRVLDRPGGGLATSREPAGHHRQSVKAPRGHCSEH
jgi:para-nitrobenzyl esterase